MLPVLKADESLRLYQATACGTGPRNKRQAGQIRRQVQDWIKVTRRYSQRDTTRRPMNADEMRAAMAGLGIKVTEVPRKRG